MNITENPVLEVIRDRYSCKEFTGKPPTREQLEAIAEAAVQAPSAMNRQRWRVIVVTDRELMKEMEEEAIGIMKGMPDTTMWEKISARGKGIFYGAPTMIIVPIEVSEQPLELVGAALDCGILCQNIALAATALDVGNLICGLTGLAFAGEKGPSLKKRLGFPEGYEIGVSVLLGESAQKLSPHQPDWQKIQWVRANEE